jgi:hypothetical protein
MYLMLVFAFFSTPETTAIPFDSLAACEAEKPRLTLALKEAGAKAYALSCVPMVKMESV